MYVRLTLPFNKWAKLAESGELTETREQLQRIVDAEMIRLQPRIDKAMRDLLIFGTSTLDLS